MSSLQMSLILLSVGISGFAQFLLKFGMARLAERQWGTGGAPWYNETITALLNPYVFSGLAMYGAGAVLWLWVLARTELSLAYPFVGLSFVLTMGLGAFAFQEAMTPSRVVGTLLIVSGCVLVAKSA